MKLPNWIKKLMPQPKPKSLTEKLCEDLQKQGIKLKTVDLTKKPKK